MANVFGVELEYEGVSVGTAYHLLRPVNKDGIWSVHADGSLRPRDASCELVFNGPKNEKQSEQAVRIWSDIAEKINSEHPAPPRRPEFEGDADAPMYFHTNWRTAMHVHVDARSEPRKFIPPIVALCTLMDPLIFNWDGHHRYESKYCTPLSRTLLRIRDRLRPSITTRGTTPVMLALGNDRYMSVNFAALSRHGSIEFRQPQSTVCGDSILEFLKICGGLFDAARSWSSKPAALLKEIDRSSTLAELAERVLAEDVAQILSRNAVDESVDLPSVLIAYSMLRSTK